MSAVFYASAAYGFTRMLEASDVKMAVCYGLVFCLAGTLALCGLELE